MEPNILNLGRYYICKYFFSPSPKLFQPEEFMFHDNFMCLNFKEEATNLEKV